MHSLRMSSRLTWYFCWIRSRRFCTRHVLLGQFHVERPALFLQLRQAPALFAQAFLARRDLRLLRLLLRHQLGGLRVHLFALVLQRLDLPRAIPGSRIPPAPCA